MQVSRIARTYRNLKRYRQILTILLRYGFDDIIDKIGITYYIKLGKKIIPVYKNDSTLEKITTARRFRLALQDLGPTFIKFGQIMSIRPDLIPANFIQEFQKLQDEVPAFSSEDAKLIITKELGQPIEQLFQSFEETPIAAASIAQVHRAKTPDGKSVVLKIQRPGIRHTIETDINILFDLANLIDKYIPESKLFNPIGIANEFAKTIRKELDFSREGRNIDRFKRNFEGDETVYVPTVFWDLTTTHILTMEYIKGIKISEFDKLKTSGLDTKIIADHGAQATLKQVFEHGFFHADPHPGNILVLPGNIIAPLDFGMMGTLDNEIREILGDLLYAIIKKNVTKILRIFSEIGITQDIEDERTLKNDITDFLERYYQIPLYQLNVEIILNEFTEIIRRHQIKLPSDFTLMGKVLVTSEGVGRSLDPEFDMITMTQPYIKKLMIRRLDPRRQIQDFNYTLEDFSNLVKILPSELKAILSKIKTGKLTIKFEHQGLESFIAELERASNRLSFGLVIAALIIGSSLIVQVDKGPSLFGFPVFGIFGYVIAAFLGLWLVIAILRSGKL